MKKNSNDKNSMNSSVDLSGHMYNPSNGCLETLNAKGEVISSLPLGEPQKQQMLNYKIKGTVLKTPLSYPKGPVPWVQSVGIIKIK